MPWREDRAGANTEVGGTSEHQTLTSRNCCGRREWKPGRALDQGALLQLSCSQTARGCRWGGSREARTIAAQGRPLGRLSLSMGVVRMGSRPSPGVQVQTGLWLPRPL